MRTTDCVERSAPATGARRHRRADLWTSLLSGSGFPAYGEFMPRVRISQRACAATQSGPGSGEWLLEFEPSARLTVDPLMGWSGGAGPLAQIRVRFPDISSAIAFAERNGWLGPGRADPSSHTEDNSGCPGEQTARDDFARWDRVDEANRDSFPASDPPSWTGSTVG
jgi:hypothetical protein